MKTRFGIHRTPQGRFHVLLLVCLFALSLAGSPPAAASDPRDPAIQQVMGPIAPFSQVRAQGGNFALYPDRAETAATGKYANYGADYTYYKWSGGAFFCSLGVASGDPKYIDMGMAVAHNYATFVISNNGQISEPSYRPQSLACAAALGDPDAKRALALLADEACRRFYRLTVYGAVDDELSGRLLTWYILTPAYANLLGATPGTNPYTGTRWDYAAVAGDAYAYVLSHQNADGSLNIGNSPHYQWGMVMDALLTWRRLFATSDNRPITFSQRALNWLFTNAYSSAEEGFTYSASDSSVSADDNGFYAAGAAAVAQSGDARGNGWFDALLAGSLDHAWWGAWQTDIQLRFVTGFAQRFGAAPANVSITPNASTQTAGSFFTLSSTHYNPGGAANISNVYLMLIDSNSNLTEYFYNATLNKLYVCSDDRSAWLGGVAPGSPVIIGNSRGSLDCSQVTVTRSDPNTLVVNWRISTSACWAGQTLGTWLFMETASGQSVGWSRLGTVTISNP